jgi:transcriptional regulator with XRE-family HTH domain
MRISNHDKYLKAFGNNLRRIRKEQHFTMESLAFQSEIEYRQIGRIERGEINTTILSVYRIAEVLHIEIYLLFLFK